MPLYLDRHDMSGSTAEDVAAAHVQDLAVQGKYGVRYLTYWFDLQTGKGFCLVEAPSKDAAETVHREAHGLVALDIIEVDRPTVEQFLGRVREPLPGQPWAETAFRAILFTDLEGSTPFTQRLGDAGAMELIRAHDVIIRDAFGRLDGSEVKHTGDGIMGSFASVSRAVECSIAIQRQFAAHNQERRDAPLRLRVGLSAGEPVTERDDLFGAAVQLAKRICDSAEPEKILVSNVVRELCIGKDFAFADQGEVMFKGFDEPVRIHEVHWRDG